MRNVKLFMFDIPRNLPRAIVISVTLITVLYVFVNFTYIAVLGADGVLQSEAVATVSLSNISYLAALPIYNQYMVT